MQHHFESARPKTKDSKPKTKGQKPKAKNPGPKTQEVSAILLAAGHSKRMGAFKPLLPFGDMTVIESCIEYLRDGGVDRIVVVLGHRANEIRAKLRELPVSFVENRDPNSEMGVSIACGVRELPDDATATFIALTDHPAVPAKVVASLIEKWRTTGAKLLLPEFAGRGGHPVLVDLIYRAELMDLDSQRGLRGLFEDHRKKVLRVPVPTPFIARDIDAWDDYAALHKEVFGLAPPSRPQAQGIR
jgi:molybdenum cofactor cytidylyltransferase